MNARIPTFAFAKVSPLPRCGKETLDIFLSTIESSIALIGTLECSDVARILTALRKQMEVSGFAAVDIETMHELTGFVCGEIEQ